jgi:hypothetical protein
MHWEVGRVVISACGFARFMLLAGLPGRPVAHDEARTVGGRLELGDEP